MHEVVDDQRIRRRVLLAEDGLDNQRLIARVLKKAGVEVTIAENGQVAVDLALTAQQAGHAFDTVLMDMQMPIMDGYEATKRLKETGCVTPIVALTAHAMDEHRQQCLDAGCDDYMSKPFEQAMLLRIVAEYSGRRAGNDTSVNESNYPRRASVLFIRSTTGSS